MITVRRNHYSVPVRLVGTKVAVLVGAREIEVLAEGKLVATHPRLRGSQLRSARLDHYLELLARKPGALEHSLALRQERERCGWPDCFDELWTLLKERVGVSEAARVGQRKSSFSTIPYARADRLAWPALSGRVSNAG